MTLNELGVKHGTDKSDDGSGHNYCRVYERYFGSFQHEQFNMLEIGVAKGASIRMWLEWFYRAEVYGMDISDGPQPEHERYHHLHGDVRDVDVWKDLPQMRLVIDDGSHLASQIRTAFGFGWANVAPGGIWVVEDLCTIYAGEYKDERSLTALDWAVERIHDLNAHGQPYMCGNPDLDNGDIAFIHFYKSLVIIGKKPLWKS